VKEQWDGEGVSYYGGKTNGGEVGGGRERVCLKGGVGGSLSSVSGGVLWVVFLSV